MTSILGNFFAAIATVLNYGLSLYIWIIIARAVLSWVSPDPFNPIVRFIHNVTEPVLYRIRSKIPSEFGGIDISPIILIFIIWFLQLFIVGSLHSISRNLILGM